MRAEETKAGVLTSRALLPRVDRNVHMEWNELDY